MSLPPRRSERARVEAQGNSYQGVAAALQRPHLSVRFVGVNGKGMFSRVDLPALGTQFSIPVFFVQGSEDLVTLPEVAKRYFDSVTAPQKEFILLPQTGHDPNAAMVEAQYSLLKKRIVPLRN